MRHSQKFEAQEQTGNILQRYNPAEAHNLIYTYDELRDLGIRPEFLMSLLEVFEDIESFDPKNFEAISIADLIDYIRKTHAYYINKKLPEIEQSMYLLGKGYPEAHPLLLLLQNFYTEYTRHLQAHIEIEERALLPYITRLTSGKDSADLTAKISISNFIDQHHDTEKDLEDVRKTILCYSPPVDQQTPYRILLSQLQVLEKDLAVHALIEDKLLLPRALAIEQKLQAPK